MSSKKSGCLWVVMGVILCFSLLLNLAALSGRAASTRARTAASESLPRTTIEEGTGEGKIAVIRLNGLISSSIRGRMGDSMVDDIKIQLKAAEKDDEVKAVVLAIDSPGGEVTASDIIYNAVTRLREKKPVVISMGSLAASGGYYIACGGSWLIANETTFTGSIGVIIQSYRYSDLLGKIGVEPLTFKSGAFKDMLNGSREMTPAESEYVQGIVMQTYSKFVGIVARERKLPEEELRNGVADGRIVTGKDAFAEKLVDQLGEVEDAYRKARELANAPGASVFNYEERGGVGRLLRLLGSDASILAGRDGKVEVNIAGGPVIPQLEPARAYLLPSLYVP